MPEPRASLEETGVHRDLAPKNGEEKSSHVRRFQLQAGKRGKKWWGTGGDSGLGSSPCPKHGCLLGPTRGRGGRLSLEGSGVGAKHFPNPYQPAGLPEGGSWEPPTFVWRLSRLHWGSQHKSQGTQWSRCSQGPSCPYSIRVWLSSSVNVHPLFSSKHKSEGWTS